jgi:formamidopyrimidine-DNA glycosylase
MPELPEVETIVRELRPQLTGRTITGVQNDWPNQINRPFLEQFRTRVSGRAILQINRRGKYLHFQLDGGEHLIIHLKMSGQLSVVDRMEPADKYVHTSFQLDDGNELRFRDVRKFGKVYLVQDPGEILEKLGPEPLTPEFTPEWLCGALKERQRLLKPLLLDQTFIAGIGNIYADESLHRAGILPIRLSNSLSDEECQQLHSAIQETLAKAITHSGSSIDSVYVRPDGSSGEMQTELMVYGREGEACYRCGQAIVKEAIGGRGSHYCLNCQS